MISKALWVPLCQVVVASWWRGRKRRIQEMWITVSSAVFKTGVLFFGSGTILLVGDSGTGYKHVLFDLFQDRFCQIRCKLEIFLPVRDLQTDIFGILDLTESVTPVTIFKEQLQAELWFCKAVFWQLFTSKDFGKMQRCKFFQAFINRLLVDCCIRRQRFYLPEGRTFLT